MESELGRRIVVRSCRSDRLFRTAPSRQTVLRGSARLRRAVPTPTGRTGQRSAVQAVPALFSRLAVRGFDRLSAVDAGRRPALRRARPTRFGGTRFPGVRATLSSGVRAEKGAIPTVRVHAAAALRAAVPAPTGRTGQRSAFQAVPALLLSRRYAVSTASRRSMPVGDRRSVARAPRGSGVRGVPSRPRDSSRSAVRPPRRYAPRCRCEHRRPI